GYRCRITPALKGPFMRERPLQGRNTSDWFPGPSAWADRTGPSGRKHPNLLPTAQLVFLSGRLGSLVPLAGEALVHLAELPPAPRRGRREPLLAQRVDRHHPVPLRVGLARLVGP